MPTRYFTPGKTSAKTHIQPSYSSSVLSTENIFKNYFPCNCNNVIKLPNTLDGYPNISTAQRRANVITNSYGNKMGFGNYYFGGNTYVNYLGRVEGQNGGGGKPIRNQF